jgi:hypothetical protein
MVVGHFGESIDRVYRYIQSQEYHYRRVTFEDEYRRFLKKLTLNLIDQRYQTLWSGGLRPAQKDQIRSFLKNENPLPFLFEIEVVGVSNGGALSAAEAQGAANR